jgi:hypothetical protein
MVIAIPPEVAEQFDEDLFAFVDDPRLDGDDPGAPEGRAPVDRPFYVGSTIPREEPPSDDEAPRVKETVPLRPAEPFVFTQEVLRDLWEGAVEAQDYNAPPRLLHRTIPVGPYQLAVIPTGRSREAVRAVLECRSLGKEIEIITPVLGKGFARRRAIAIWVYQDESVAVVHLDFQSRVRYIFWHAPNAHQFNFSYLDELRHSLSTAGMQLPDELDRILTWK